MGWWRDQVVPRLVDRTLSSEQAVRSRRRVCGSATGTVLEVGFGSGRNLEHYPDAVDTVLAAEPSDLAWARAQPAIAAFGRPVRRVSLDAARLPVDDGAIDTVVSTWTMCTLPDLAAALAEIRRVLRPDGTLRFVEHGLAPDESVRRQQRRLQPVWGPIAGGCHLDRDVLAGLADAGLTADAPDARYLAWPRAFSWCVTGSARCS